MQFITTGNRIAVENFEIGYFYTITMLSGNYFQACCTGIGSDFVMFSRDEPDLLFSLTMQSAADVSSIELYGGGSGTNDYNDLSNKPQINSITLIGNKSLSDLGIQDTISDLDTIRSGADAGATAVQPADLATALATKQDTISDLDTIRSGAAAGSTAVQPAAMATALAAKQDTISDLDTIRSGADAGATAVQPADLATALATKQDTISDLDTIRSGAAAGSTAVQPAAMATALAAKQDTISDLDTIRSGAAAGSTAVQPAAMATALATKQDTISDLDTIRSGAAAGSTAVQPAAMATALATKQDSLTSAQLAAVNSGIDSTKVAQIETNKNNISYIAKNNVINTFIRQTGSYTNNGVTFTTNADGSVTLANTATGGAAVLTLSSTLNVTDDTYILYGDGFIDGVYMDTYETGWTNQRTFNSWIDTVPNTKIWRIVVSNGTNADGVTIRPMMCKKSLFDSSYHQYAMSNEQITAWIIAHS